MPKALETLIKRPILLGGSWGGGGGGGGGVYVVIKKGPSSPAAGHPALPRRHGFLALRPVPVWGMQWTAQRQGARCLPEFGAAATWRFMGSYG